MHFPSSKSLKKTESYVHFYVPTEEGREIGKYFAIAFSPFVQVPQNFESFCQKNNSTAYSAFPRLTILHSWVNILTSWEISFFLLFKFWPFWWYFSSIAVAPLHCDPLWKIIKKKVQDMRKDFPNVLPDDANLFFSQQNFCLRLLVVCGLLGQIKLFIYRYIYIFVRGTFVINNFM